MTLRGIISVAACAAMLCFAGAASAATAAPPETTAITAAPDWPPGEVVVETVAALAVIAVSTDDAPAPASAYPIGRSIGPVSTTSPDPAASALSDAAPPFRLVPT